MQYTTDLRSTRPRREWDRELHCVRRGMSAGLPCFLWQRFGAAAYRRPFSLHRPDAWSHVRKEGRICHLQRRENFYEPQGVKTRDAMPNDQLTS